MRTAVFNHLSKFTPLKLKDYFHKQIGVFRNSFKKIEHNYFVHSMQGGGGGGGGLPYIYIYIYIYCSPNCYLLYLRVT